MDLNLLVAFDMLMREQNVTRAAQRLSIGQASMSARLARVRKLFQDPILVREGRQMVPTPLAMELARSVRELLTDVESILSRRDAFDPSTTSRTFVVLASDSLTITFLQPLLARLSSDAPAVRLDIYPTDDNSLDLLETYKADLLLLPRPALVSRSNFLHRELLRDRYVVAVDRNHPEVRNQITLEQFSRLPYLATSAGHSRSLADRQLDLLGVERNVEATASFGTAPFLLRDSPLITLVHERLARRVSEAAGIRALEPPIPQLQPITQIMVWTKRMDSDRGSHWLREEMVRLARELSTVP